MKKNDEPEAKAPKGNTKNPTIPKGIAADIPEGFDSDHTHVGETANLATLDSVPATCANWKNPDAVPIRGTAQRGYRKEK